MEQILGQLAVNIPVGVALLIMAGMFLRYLREERKEWRETVMRALENNTMAMTGQSESLRLQAENLKLLCLSFQKHDDMARAAIQRLLEQHRPA